MKPVSRGFCDVFDLYDLTLRKGNTFLVEEKFCYADFELIVGDKTEATRRWSIMTSGSEDADGYNNYMIIFDY